MKNMKLRVLGNLPKYIALIRIRTQSDTASHYVMKFYGRGQQTTACRPNPAHCFCTIHIQNGGIKSG